jgi:hypothetical protein
MLKSPSAPEDWISQGLLASNFPSGVGFPQRDDLAEQIGGPRISDERNFDKRQVRRGRQT